MLTKRRNFRVYTFIHVFGADNGRQEEFKTELKS